MSPGKQNNRKKKVDIPLSDSDETLEESSSRQSEEMQPTSQSRKRKRDANAHTEIDKDEIELKKRRTSRTDKPTQTTKNENAAKYVNEVYQKENEHIYERNEILEKYVPDSLEKKPDDMQVLKIQNYSRKDFKELIGTEIAIEYRVEGLGKRYYIFQVENRAQLGKIIHEINLIHQASPLKENRRLDSLARLLEGNHICAAISYEVETSTILITTNDVDKHEKANCELLTDLMNYFLSSCEGNNNRTELFERLAWAQLRSESKKGVKISQATARRITNSISEGKIEGKVSEYPIKELINIAKEGIITNNVEEVAEIVRAFLFAEKYYRDFCKVKDFLKGKKLKFKILFLGEEDVHAELRMVDGRLKRQEMGFKQKPQYIGISKLCCPKCELAIKVINFIVGGKGLFEVRGGHGTLSQKSAAKWEKPDFLRAEKIQDFPSKIRTTLHQIQTAYMHFSHPDERIRAKVCEIFNLVEGSLIKLVKGKYKDYLVTLDAESSTLSTVIDIKDVLNDRENFEKTLNTHDFLRFQVQENGKHKDKYLDLQTLIIGEFDFSSFYFDLFLINFFIVEQEKKHIEQRASPSSSDVSGEELMTKKDNILNNLKDTIKYITRIQHKKEAINSAAFKDLVVQMLDIEIELKFEPKDLNFYISLINMVIAEIKKLSDDEITNERIKKIFDIKCAELGRKSERPSKKQKQGENTLKSSSFFQAQPAVFIGASTVTLISNETKQFGEYLKITKKALGKEIIYAFDFRTLWETLGGKQKENLNRTIRSIQRRNFGETISAGDIIEIAFLKEDAQTLLDTLKEILSLDNGILPGEKPLENVQAKQSFAPKN